jgi:hypothetical protein
VDEETQFQSEYRKRLDLSPGVAFPRRLVRDLSLADARHLDLLLCELHIELPLSAEKSSPVQQAAAKCASVIDLAQDQEWLPGSQIWQPLAEQIDNLAQKGVPTAPLALTVLAARVSNALRESLHDSKRWPTETYELVKGFEDEYARLLDGVTGSVKDLRHWVSERGELTGEELTEGEKDAVRRKVLGSGSFPASSAWWRRHGAQLVDLVADLEQTFKADRDNSGARARAELMKRAREPFTPGRGHRKGEYPAGIYCAYETALELVRTHWQKRGAVAKVKRLFSAVGIELGDGAPRQVRWRKREAVS